MSSAQYHRRRPAAAAAGEGFPPARRRVSCGVGGGASHAGSGAGGVTVITFDFIGPARQAICYGACYLLVSAVGREGRGLLFSVQMDLNMIPLPS